MNKKISRRSEIFKRLGIDAKLLTRVIFLILISNVLFLAIFHHSEKEIETHDRHEKTEEYSVPLSAGSLRLELVVKDYLQVHPLPAKASLYTPMGNRFISDILLIRKNILTDMADQGVVSSKILFDIPQQKLKQTLIHSADSLLILAPRSRTQRPKGTQNEIVF